MTEAEVLAYLAGREVAGHSPRSVAPAVAATEMDYLTHRPDLRAAFERLGPEAFREWVYRGCWDRLGEPDALR
jgi:hypothetical protein